MIARLHALVVPALIALASLAYFWQVAGQRSAVTLVPYAVLALIALFLALVVLRDMRAPPPPPDMNAKALAKPLALIGLCILYYFAFRLLGFHIANFLFVVAVATLMEMPLLKALIVAACATAVLFAMSWAMAFNVPDPFWAR